MSIGSTNSTMKRAIIKIATSQIAYQTPPLLAALYKYNLKMSTLFPPNHENFYENPNSNFSLSPAMGDPTHSKWQSNRSGYRSFKGSWSLQGSYQNRIRLPSQTTKTTYGSKY